MRIRAGAAAPHLAVALVAFLLVLLLWVLTHSSGGVSAAVARGQTPQAPEFSLEPLSGSRRVDLERYAGRVLVVNFWASWCGPCRSEAPALERLWRRWRSHLVTFVGVDVHDVTGDARGFARASGLSYPLGRDASGQAARVYGVGNLPATFVISTRGRVVARFLGPVSAQELDRVIARTLRSAGAA